MKKKSDDLFQLIKSFSPNEKRDFKLSRKQEGITNYMRVFDAIDAMDEEEYDEQIIHKTFEGEQFLKQLHALKNNLYNLLLKSLRNSHEEKFVESQLYNLLSEAVILQERGLYKLSEKQLDKALKIARKYDKQLVILKILRHQLSNLIETGVKNVSETFEHHFQLINNTLENIHREYDYTKLHYGLIIPSRHGRRRNPDLDQEIEWITNDPLFKTVPETSLTFEARFYYLNMYVTYYTIRQEMEKAVDYLRQILEHWRSHPDMIKHKPRLYLIQLSNYVNCKIGARLYDDIEEIIEEIRTLPLQSFRDKAERFQNEKNHLLRYYLNTRQFGKAEVLIPEIKKGLEIYGTKINEARLITIYYHALMLYFFLEKHTECIEWIDHILNNDRTTPRKEVKQAVRIFEIAVHYEMGNKRVLDSMFEATQKKLKRSNALMHFEKQVLKHFRKLSKNTDEDKHPQLLQQFLNELEPIMDTRPVPAGCEEIYLWIKSKLDNRPLRDFV